MVVRAPRDVEKIANETLIVIDAENILIMGDSDEIKALVKYYEVPPPSREVIVFSDVTSFENLSESKRLRIEKAGEEAAHDAVNQALQADVSRESLDDLARVAAKKAIYQEISKQEKIVVTSSKMVDLIVIESVDTALQTQAGQEER